MKDLGWANVFQGFEEIMVFTEIFVALKINTAFWNQEYWIFMTSFVTQFGKKLTNKKIKIIFGIKTGYHISNIPTGCVFSLSIAWNLVW